MAIPSLFLLLTTIFVVMHILPGDPVRAMLGPKVPESEAEIVRHELGLDRPLYQQYLSYLSGVLRGDLGVSLSSKRPVIVELSKAWSMTVELTLVGLLFGVALGFSTGLVSAFFKDKIPDHILRGIAFFNFSMPSFWLALMLQLLFSVQLRMLPIAGRFPPTMTIKTITGLYVLDSILTLNFNAFVESLRRLFLPGISLGIGLMPMLSRVCRASIITEYGEEYVVTARAKGLSMVSVLLNHILRNAWLPIITIIALNFASLLGGTIIIETMFSLPGLGRLLVHAVVNRDYMLTQGICVLYALLVVIVNALVDVIYGVMDPRVKF